MDPDYGLEDDGPFFAWLPPEDRLWRHPSEGAPVVGEPPTPGFGPHRTWAIALVAAVVGAVAASGVGMASGAFQRATVIDRAVQTTSAVTVASAERPAAGAWTAIDNRTAPAVVGLSVTGPAGVKTGSGVLLFSNYVVTDRALLTLSGEPTIGCCIGVTMVNGERLAGRLVGEDPLSGLAVISVGGDHAVYPEIGSIASVRALEPVIAVPARTSSPFSVLTGTVSGEAVRVNLSGGADIDDLIAVTPSLPAGTAGAPIVDQSGKVVGITLSLVPMDGTAPDLTFAVPVDEAMYVTKELVAGDSIFHPWLGVADANDVPVSVAKSLGLPGGVTAGSVAAGSPASLAGLEASDIIYSFDGQAVDSAGALTAALAKCQPNRTTTISFIHDYRRLTRQLVVQNEPNDS